MASRSINTTGIDNLNGTFQKITVDMGTPFSTFTGFVSLLQIQGSDWNGTASTLTMAISQDAAGDKLLITDTDSTIYAGKTTATACNAGWKIDAIIAAPSNYLYCWFKTDSGTLDIETVIITLRDE